MAHRTQVYAGVTLIVLLLAAAPTIRGIVNGTAVEPRDELGLLNLEIGRGPGTTICSGVLVASQWALTAAHCTSGAQSADARACLWGQSAKYPFGQGCATADRVLVHPQFVSTAGDPDSRGLDIAVWHLAKAFDLPLNSRVGFYSGTLESLRNSTLTCSGYGTNIRRYEERADASELSMRAADLTVSSLTKWGYLLQTNDAAQITTTGDSGGPCMTNEGLRRSVTGIHSERELISGNGSYSIIGVDSGTPLFKGWVRDIIYPERTAAPRLPVRSVEMVGIADGNGKLWQTVRRDDGVYYRPLDLSVPLHATQAMGSVALARDSASSLHLLVASANGQSLWHALRTGSDWTTLADVKAEAGDFGPALQVSAAATAQGLNVLVLGRDGRLVHTLRHPAGNWERFGDVLAETGIPGRLVRIGSAADSLTNDLHVLAITSDGQIWHSIRASNGNWTPLAKVPLTSLSAIFDISAAVTVDVMQTGPPALFTELQVVWATRAGLWRTTRTRTGSWNQPEDVSAQAGEARFNDFRGQDPGQIVRITAAAPDGRLQIWAATQFGHLWWTRLDQTKWRRFENAESEADADAMPLLEISSAAVGTYRQPTRADVSANVLWVDTGLDFRQGEPVNFVASGLWSNAGAPALGPEGFPGYTYPNTVLGIAPLASLIGKVGNNMFYIGPALEGVSPGDGRLYLSINDTPDTFADNQGLMHVVIR